MKDFINTYDRLQFFFLYYAKTGLITTFQQQFILSHRTDGMNDIWNNKLNKRLKGFLDCSQSQDIVILNHVQCIQKTCIHDAIDFRPAWNELNLLWLMLRHSLTSHVKYKALSTKELNCESNSRENEIWAPYFLCHINLHFAGSL